LAPSDFITPMSARFIAELASEIGGHPGILSAVLCAAHTPDIEPLNLQEIAAPDNPRVARALQLRRDVRVFMSGDKAGLLTIGRGLGGRWEASFEVRETHRSRGLGRALALHARHLVPAGAAVFMQIAPGNAASTRAAWSAGYRAIGSEILFVKEHRTS
jgi:GNAT superfamily N-acetyltransferase